VSYHRELEWNEPPTPGERLYAHWTVVRAVGEPAACWWPLAQIGAVRLHLAPPGSEREAPASSITPLVAGKRGRRGSGDYPGVDGDVQTDGFADAAAVLAPPRPHPFPPVVIDSDAIRVAIVDVSFDKLSALPPEVEGPMRVGLPGGDDFEPSRPVLGHGTMMAGVVLAACPGAHVGLFQIPSVAGAARPYLATADLATAIAAAVGAWAADVVLIAMSDGAWGTPRYLRDVLREAARWGRRGRGTPIVCSVGDPSRNHVREDDSPTLGADDLASQPWVHAVAACDGEGRWYRVYPGYACPGPANGNDAWGAGELGAPRTTAGGQGRGRVGPPTLAPPMTNAGNGATYNRLGPAVAFTAPGEPTRWSEHIAADDSSQASALAAAAAARVLSHNRDLTVPELRALLALTADVPAAVDGGRGLGAGAFDARDRLGHNFKVGHGAVNARAASLGAADPVCLALLATRAVPDLESQALALAEAWLHQVQRVVAEDNTLAQAYARVAGRVSRLFLTSLPVQEALCWLARHVRALSEAARWRFWQAQDHGALVERIRHACETAREALGPDDQAIAADLQLLETALAGPGAGVAVATVLATAFRPGDMASHGGKGEPRATALTREAVGDHHGRRRPDGADGGGELERVPFARPDVSRVVHRSPR
jgi:hypothetical protein